MFRAWLARNGLGRSRTADSGNARASPAVPSGTYPLVQPPDAARNWSGMALASTSPAAAPPRALSTARLLTG